MKGHNFYSVGPNETVYTAIKIMACEDVGSLLVMDGDVFVGIFTERDYAREVMLKGRTSLQTLVRDIMKTEVTCVQPDESVEACMELMTLERVRHLPVTNCGRVVGLVSIGDLVKGIINEQRFMIGQLESYIHGELL